MDKIITPEVLLDELSTAWQMLRVCLPLARKTLLAGGVDLLDQQSFWDVYGSLECYCECDEQDQGSGHDMTEHIEEILTAMQELAGHKTEGSVQ